MASNKGNNGDTKRTKGSIFQFTDGLGRESKSSRNVGIFIPDSTDTLTDVPESITAGERLPHLPEYESIGLESLPVKGFKTFLYGFGLLVFVIATAEIYSIYQYAVGIHSIVAVVYLLILLLVIGLGLRALWNYLRDPDSLSTLVDIQLQASRVQQEKTFGNSKPFVERLVRFYADKPHAVHLQRCIDQLPDYNNDQETIDHVERVFLEPLDNEAIRRVSTHCLQTGTVVAASPWAAADTLLSLWRSIKMIDDISEVYGLRPSLPNRLKLFKSVTRQMIFVGASELAIDMSIEVLGSQSLVAMASARVGQGIGAATYTARIGIAAMRVTRPIEFSEAKLPSSSAVIGPVLAILKKLVTKSGS